MNWNDTKWNKLNCNAKCMYTRRISVHLIPFQFCRFVRSLQYNAVAASLQLQTYLLQCRSTWRLRRESRWWPKLSTRATRRRPDTSPRSTFARSLATLTRTRCVCDDKLACSLRPRTSAKTGFRKRTANGRQCQLLSMYWPVLLTGKIRRPSDDIGLLCGRPAVSYSHTTLGALKTRDWKMRNWKTRHQIAGVKNARLENPALNHRGGKRGTGKRGDLKVMESRRCRKCAT